MFHIISLTLILYALWLLLSGHYTILLLVVGALSVLTVIFISKKMGIVDKEGHPIRFLFRGITYWPWLVLQIIKSNIDIALRILNPSLSIQPKFYKIVPTQETDLGKTIFANSITLTPGTITIEIQDADILVHALTKDAADELSSGKMDRKVTSMEK